MTGDCPRRRKTDDVTWRITQRPQLLALRGPQDQRLGMRFEQDKTPARHVGDVPLAASSNRAPGCQPQEPVPGLAATDRAARHHAGPWPDRLLAPRMAK